MEALWSSIKESKRRFFFVLQECKRHGKRDERIGGWCVHEMKTMEIK